MKSGLLSDDKHTQQGTTKHDSIWQDTLNHVMIQARKKTIKPLIEAMNQGTLNEGHPIIQKLKNDNEYELFINFLSASYHSDNSRQCQLIWQKLEPTRYRSNTDLITAQAGMCLFSKIHAAFFYNNYFSSADFATLKKELEALQLKEENNAQLLIEKTSATHMDLSTIKQNINSFIYFLNEIEKNLKPSLMTLIGIRVLVDLVVEYISFPAEILVEAEILVGMENSQKAKSAEHIEPSRPASKKLPF